jgi:hypothetical protein
MAALPSCDLDAVRQRYGNKGVDILEHLADDGTFILDRYGHMLASSTTVMETDAVWLPWQVVEIGVLAETHTSLAAEQRRRDLADKVEADLARPESKGRSVTFDGLLTELAESREAELQNIALEVCKLFANIAGAELRKEYESELAKLSEQCSDYAIKVQALKKTKQILQQEQERQEHQQGTAPASVAKARWQFAGRRLMTVAAAVRQKSLIAQIREHAETVRRSVSFSGRERHNTELFAEWAMTRRRDITTKFKQLTPYPLRHYIFFVNLERYQDPIGIDWETACKKYKNDYEKIIGGASRPNGDVNALLRGFHTWLLLQSEDYIRNAGEYVRAHTELAQVERRHMELEENEVEVPDASADDDKIGGIHTWCDWQQGLAARIESYATSFTSSWIRDLVTQCDGTGCVSSKELVIVI